MLDVVYVVLTAGFFAAMLMYTRACESLGAGTEESRDRF